MYNNNNNNNKQTNQWKEPSIVYNLVIQDILLPVGNEINQFRY